MDATEEQVNVQAAEHLAAKYLDGVTVRKVISIRPANLNLVARPSAEQRAISGITPAVGLWRCWSPPDGWQFCVAPRRFRLHETMILDSGDPNGPLQVAVRNQLRRIT